MNVSAQTVLSKPRHIVWREVDKEGILLNLEDGFYYGVNHAGLTLWKEVDGKRTLAQIAPSLCQFYRVSEAQALRDAVRWASHLVRRKLIALG